MDPHDWVETMVNSIHMAAIFGESERQLETIYMISNHVYMRGYMCVCMLQRPLTTDSTKELLCLRTKIGNLQMCT